MTNANAGLATGTGTAQPPRFPYAGLATGRAAAQQAGGQHALLASAAGTAQQPGISAMQSYFPGTAPNSVGLKVELSINGVWTDITAYILQRDQVQISNMGRTNEQQTIQASQLVLTLKNKDGRFTPRNTAGAYYPYIALNTPIRVSVNARSASGATYSGYRFSGEVLLAAHL